MVLLSPRSALREASRREQRLWQEQSDHNELKSLVSGVETKSVRPDLSMSSTSERACKSELLMAGYAATPRTILASSNERVQTQQHTDVSWTSTKAKVAEAGSYSELSALALALVLHLWMSSAFLTVRDEMAFVLSVRTMVELGHGETRAFVGLL
jgi:hypothetical protein